MMPFDKLTARKSTSLGLKLPRMSALGISECLQIISPFLYISVSLLPPYLMIHKENARDVNTRTHTHTHVISASVSPPGEPPVQVLRGPPRHRGLLIALPRELVR